MIMQTISSGGQSQAQQAPPAVSHRGSTPATPFGGGGGGGSTAGYNSLAKSSSGDTWSALASGVSLGWPSTRFVGGCCREKRLMLTFSAAAAAPGLGEACGELQMGISTAGTLLSSHSSPTTSLPRACRSLKPAPGSYKHNECQNKRRHRGEEGKWLPPRWDTSRLPKQQQIHNNEQFLKPILCLELLSDGGGSSSHACVKTKL